MKKKLTKTTLKYHNYQYHMMFFDYCKNQPKLFGIGNRQGSKRGIKA